MRVDDDAPSALVTMAGSNLSRPWTTLRLILAAIGIVYGFIQDSPSTEKQNEIAASEPAQPATAKKQKQESAVREPDIYPGESRNVLLTMYLPYLHLNTYSSLRIDPVTKVIGNTLEEEGLSVDIIDTTITDETVMLWERQRQSDGHWVPNA